MNFKITPWEVEGKVDYDKLVTLFGVEKIGPELMDRIKKITGDLHLLLRRNYFFSHRDLDKVLDSYEQGNGFFLYTGRGPSGPMHIGNLIPFLFTKWLQEKFKVNVYIEITDDEKFLEPKRKLTLEDTKKWSYENILDIIAVGFDEERTFIFQDTEYIRNVYPLVLKIAKKINFSQVKSVFGFKCSTNIGLIFFPSLQIVQTFFEEKIYKYAFSGGQPTIEMHRKLGGNPDIDVSFQWLKILFEEDDNKLKKIEEDYRSGRLLTGELKEILIEKVVRFLEEHMKKRERAKELIQVFKYEGKLAKEMWEKIFW